MNKKNLKILALLPFLIMALLAVPELAIAQEIPIKDSDKEFMNVENINAVQDRPWATTPEQIQNHKNFLAYVGIRGPDNYVNNAITAENIRSYNIETQIGVEVPGYELAALHARLQIIKGTYNPTVAEKKMHDWAFLAHDVSGNLDQDQIRARVSEITGNADSALILDLVDSTNKLVNLGAASIELRATDPEYWITLSNIILCEHDENCDPVMFGMTEPAKTPPVLNNTTIEEPSEFFEDLTSHIWAWFLAMTKTQQMPQDISGKFTTSTDSVQDRPWATTPEQIQNHKNFLEYVKVKGPDNYLNNAIKAENIRSYNLETQIGVEVPGYELAALHARLQIIHDAYNPTKHERKIHDRVFTFSNIPKDENQVHARISEITRGADSVLVQEMVDSIHRLTNMGIVGSELGSSQYWGKLSSKILCEHVEGCEIIGIDDAAKVIPVSSYVFHGASIIARYPQCEIFSDLCVAIDYNMGDKIETSTFNAPSQILDHHISIQMHAWSQKNTFIMVEGQVTAPQSGSPLVGYKETSYITKVGAIGNPNGHADVPVEITFTSRAFT